MKSSNSLSGLLGYPATLVFWLAASCAALVSTETNSAIIGILTLAIISAFAMLIASTILVAVVSAAAILLFGFYLQSFTGLENINLFALLTFSAAAIGTAIIASQTRAQIVSSSSQVEREKLLIEELRINDTRTGLMRFHYARRTLSTEISRSLRFGKNLSLLVMRIEGWDELAEEIGMDARENLLASISEILFSAFRNIDTLYLNIDKIGVILPETTEEGAVIVARRVIDQVFRKTKIKIIVGLACFPNDSIADEELFRKGELALSTAIKTGQDVYRYSKLKNYDADRGNDLPDPDSSDDLQDLALNFDSDPKNRQTPKDVSYLIFSGITSLSEVDPIQKALININEFKNIRLIDFKENELVFAVSTKIVDIRSLIVTHLKIEIENISSNDDGYQIAWNNVKK